MATNPYVNKVQFGNQTVMDITDTTAEEADVVSGKTFYKASGQRSTGTATLTGGVPEEELRDTVGWTGKNLLQIPSSVVNGSNKGITYTVNRNANGEVTSVVANGTASADSFFNLGYDNVAIENTVLNGLGGTSLKWTGGTSLGGSLVFSSKLSDGTGTQDVYNVGTENTINLRSDAGLKITVLIKVDSGVTASDLTFYPMLRYASVTDSTYEPYHESVKQVLRDSEVIEGKNLLNPDILSVADVTGLTYVPIYVGNGDFTLSTTAPLNSQDTANLFLLAGNVSSGASTPTNGVYINNPITQTAINGYITVASRSYSGVAIKQYNNQLEEGTIPTTYEPYYIPLKDSKFDRSEQRVLGAKNLLPNKVTSQTINGLTITVNADGTIKVNGTASARTELVICTTPKFEGECILSGCPSGGTNETYKLQYSNNVNQSYGDFGEGIECTQFDYSQYPSAKVSLMVGNGYVANNLTFKPMLRLASDPDDTYVPYAKTNKELTDIAPTYIERSYVTVSAGQVVRIPSGDEDYRIQSTSAIFPVCSSDASYTSIAQENGHVNITMATALTNATVGIFVYNS